MMLARWFFLLPILLQAGEEMDPEAGEFNVFLFCLLIVALTAFCLLVAIGIVVGLLVAAAMVGAGFLGIFANALISGLVCKSPRVGVTVLTLQFGGLIGLTVGTASCLAARCLLTDNPVDLVPLLICGAFGMILGAGMAWVSLRLIVAAFTRIKEYYDLRSQTRRKSSAVLASTNSPEDGGGSDCPSSNCPPP